VQIVGVFVWAANQKNVERVKAERLFWMKQIFSRIFLFSFQNKNWKTFH